MFKYGIVLFAALFVAPGVAPAQYTQKDADTAMDSAKSSRFSVINSYYDFAVADYVAAGNAFAKQWSRWETYKSQNTLAQGFIDVGDYWGDAYDDEDENCAAPAAYSAYVNVYYSTASLYTSSFYGGALHYYVGEEWGNCIGECQGSVNAYNFGIYYDSLDLAESVSNLQYYVSELKSFLDDNSIP